MLQNWGGGHFTALSKIGIVVNNQRCESKIRIYAKIRRIPDPNLKSEETESRISDPNLKLEETESRIPNPNLKFE